MSGIEMMKYSAIHFLYQWLTIESKFYESFQSNNTEIRRKKAIEIATYFKVVRNFSKKYDEGLGLKRFEPVINILDKNKNLNLQNINEAALLINDMTNELSLFYKCRVMSFASKLLWMENRYPIIIYDKKVRDGLSEFGYPSGDNNIFQYYDSWFSLYDKYRFEVIDSCDNLKKLNLNVKNLNEIIESDWFKNRVFDIYIWFKGSGSLPRQELLNLL